MGQVLRADDIPQIFVLTTSLVSLTTPTYQTIGGGQFRVTGTITCNNAITGPGGLDTGSIAANTLYHLYLVRASGVISLVASVNSTAPVGFVAYKKVGRASTDGSSNWNAAGNHTADDTGKIGQVMSAMLTEAQFQAIHGSNWILADGRNVAGSSYNLTTGSATVPDMRGMVLRGKNNGRADGSQNPDGDLNLGVFQDHQLGSHDHDMFTRASSGVGGAFVISSSNAANTFNDTASIQNRGGNETRMRNITVNHFIKIN